jgi:predicted ATPase
MHMHMHMHMRPFNTLPLDALLLSYPFQTHTHWYVLTGAACVGKTTLLEALAGQDYRIVPESARAYFEAEQAKGRTLPEIRADDAALQCGILDLQLSYESNVPVDQVAFLDRAVPDSLTFFRVFGLDPNEILPQCFSHRYAGVFILDRLPLRRDQTLGPEDDAASGFLDGCWNGIMLRWGIAWSECRCYPPMSGLHSSLETWLRKRMQLLFVPGWMGTNRHDQTFQ